MFVYIILVLEWLNLSPTTLHPPTPHPPAEQHFHCYCTVPVCPLNVVGDQVVLCTIVDVTFLSIQQSLEPADR